MVIIPNIADDNKTDHSDDDNVDSIGGGDDDDDKTKESTSPESISKATVPMRAFNNSNTTWIWEFPYNISQSTYQGRNGSNACSIIALIAQGIHQVNCDLDPSPMLPSLWVTGVWLVGNALYDCSRGSLPQRYLSAAEAAMVAGDKLEAWVEHPLAVRISDLYPPSTIRYQRLGLCTTQGVSFAVFIVDKKTVLFVGIKNDKLVLIDIHLHCQEGAIIIVDKHCNIDGFLCAVQ